MFTGIIEEVGTIKQMVPGKVSYKITVKAPKVIKGTNIGDSIATNGVCLTVTDIRGDCYDADIMAESVRRTNFSEMKAGSRVNLERALTLNSRLGGHIVSGHVDGTGRITDMTKEDNAVWVTISTSSQILKYIIEKGSITIDGISLTVAYVDDKCFKVSVIPHTGEETTLLTKKPGNTVNLENDLIGKYVEKLMGFKEPEQEQKKSGGITAEFLMENGFL